MKPSLFRLQGAHKENATLGECNAKMKERISRYAILLALLVQEYKYRYISRYEVAAIIVPSTY